MPFPNLSSCLEALQRGIALIETTREPDDQQVMLGMLFRDLRAARRRLKEGTPDQISRFLGLSRAAGELRRRLGAPLAPEDAGEASTEDEWVAAGVRPPVARSLRDAGLKSPAELATWTREQVLEMPRMGGASVKALERALGCSFASATDAWTRLGLPPRVARALVAAGIQTLEELARKSREELLALKAMGEKAVHCCEVLLGRASQNGAQGRWTAFLRRMPKAAIWVDAGVAPRTAAALVRAGITGLEALARLTRDEVLSIPGVGEDSVKKCEKVLGRQLASLPGLWRERGLPAWVANRLHAGGIGTFEALAQLSREDLSDLGLESVGIRHCEQVLGRPVFSRVQFWRALGLDAQVAWRLARARIATVLDLRARSSAALADFGLRENDIAACERAWSAWLAFSGLADAEAPGVAAEAGGSSFEPVCSTPTLGESSPSYNRGPQVGERGPE